MLPLGVMLGSALRAWDYSMYRWRSRISCIYFSLKWLILQAVVAQCLPLVSGTFTHHVRRVGATPPKANTGTGHFLFHLISSLTEILKSHTPAYENALKLLHVGVLGNMGEKTYDFIFLILLQCFYHIKLKRAKKKKRRTPKQSATRT